jgi:antirestriction protein ArdC
MVCARLGLTAEPRIDHAQYIAHWLKLLKSDKKAIFAASAKASEAANYMMRFLDGE